MTGGPGGKACEQIKKSETFKTRMEPDESGISSFDRQRAAMSAARAAKSCFSRLLIRKCRAFARYFRKEY